VIASELGDFRQDQRWDERMQNFTDKHPLEGARDIADVAAYVSRMPAVQMPREHGEYSQHDGELYAKACVSCHGPKGEGDDLKRVPRLAGQRYEYLLAQFYYIAGGKRPNSAAAHGQLLKGLRRADYVDLADYLSGLAP
jgi:cytochrome c553